jgi:ethanolamine ammonia-lyase small subunit
VELLPHLADFTLGSIVIAAGARVAIGDAIGELLAAKLVILVIGERPGLTTPRSLGAYLTYQPRVGCTDADRNCVSNIHAMGLPRAEAAAKIAWLARAALTRQVSGVALKDDSGRPTLASL